MFVFLIHFPLTKQRIDKWPHKDWSLKIKERHSSSLR